MKKYLFILFSLCFAIPQLISQVTAPSHDVHEVDPRDPVVVCPFTDEIIDIYKPTPEELLRKGRDQPMEFQVTYDPTVSFPPDLRNAFEDGALNLLSQFFSSSVPVRIFVTENATGGNTLASAGPSSYRRFVPEAPCYDCWYPVALVEKMLGQSLNGDNFDLFVTINLDANFYYDFENPFGIGARFDFVTIVMHEIFHGLGFISFPGSTVDESGAGSLLDGGSPSAYSAQMEDEQGNLLLDAFLDGSPDLGEALTSGSLFFGSESFSFEDRAQLYAPSTYSSGSSLGHLDNTRYVDTQDELMTPFAARARVNRDPGIALTMMNDLGWTSTSIIYVNIPEEDLEIDPTGSLEVTVRVRTDEEVDFSTLRVVYSYDNFATSASLPLLQDDEAETYSTLLPGSGEAGDVDYYFEIETTSRRVVTSPGINNAGQQITYVYTFGFDEDAPVITHEPEEAINATDPAIVIEAKVDDDFTGVDTVFLVWALNDDPLDTLGMTLDEDNGFEDDLYFVELPLLNSEVDDTLRYQIVAVDQSINQNQAVFPEAGQVKVPVEDLLEALVTYINNFESLSDDFTGDFTIDQPDGFNTQAIHSPHPYPESGEGNTTDLTYELTIPIQLKEGLGTLSFDEIVLVEPGEPGTQFGDVEFWDYVAVEAKKVGARDWIPLATPYDSRDRTIWEDVYNSGFNGNISTGEGDPSLYRTRSIDMFFNGDFQPEDIVLIRFRLFSDPFAAGWGWAIDNLEIQNQAITAISPVIAEETSLKLFPNPVGDQGLTVELHNTGTRKAESFRIVDPLGRTQFQQKLDPTGELFRTKLETQRFSPGLYTFLVVFDDGSIQRRRFLKTELTR